MTDQITNSFKIEYGNAVHMAYQRMGSKLRNTVRTKGNVKGSSTIFQKAGKGTASEKSRHGLVPTMNVAHTPVTCTMTDHYAGDWVDKLDELKADVNEMQIQAQSGAYALGRKTDDLIITAMDASTINTGSAVAIGSFAIADVLEAFELLNNADVPDDGGRWAVVTPKGWNALLLIDQFAKSDYVGHDQLPFKTGVQVKNWLGIKWMMHSGLTNAGSSTARYYMYHQSSVGHGIGAEVTPDITWHGDRASHFVNHYMSQGAALIDETGCVLLNVDES